MKTKLVIVVVLVAAAAAVGVVRTASTIQRKAVPYKDRLKWYANEAKNKGQQKVRVPAPLIEYLGGAGGISAEEAFSSSTVVAAHLVSKQSTYSDADITTWNKFAIDETLSRAKDLTCPGMCAAFPSCNCFASFSRRVSTSQNWRNSKYRWSRGTTVRRRLSGI